MALDSNWELAVPCHTAFFIDTGLHWLLTILFKKIISYPEIMSFSDYKVS